MYRANKTKTAKRRRMFVAAPAHPLPPSFVEKGKCNDDSMHMHQPPLTYSTDPWLTFDDGTEANTKTGPFATAYCGGLDAANRARSRNVRRTHCYFGFNWGFCRQGPAPSFCSLRNGRLIQFERL